MTDLLKQEFSRKSFVRRGGALVVGFSLAGAGLASTTSGANRAGIPPLGSPLGGPWPLRSPNALDSWIKIGQDNLVTVFTGATESSQGRPTSFAQIVAEELDLPVSAVTFIMGDTAVSPEQGDGGGSRGIRFQVKPLQYAAAEARQVLLGLAAARFGVPAAQLAVRDGVVRLTGNPGQSVTYGELIGNKLFNVTLNTTDISAKQFYTAGRTVVYTTGKAQLKDPSQYKLVGQPVPRVDIPDKVTGKFTYVQQVRLPGMAHARLVLPPTPSSKLVRVNSFKGPKPQDLIKVVTSGDFIAVVTENEWSAIQAIKTLDVEWSEPQATLPTSEGLYDALRAAPKVIADVTSPRNGNVIGQVVDPNRGNVDSALATAARSIQADYEFPVQSHGPIGPACSVAYVSGGQATVWCPTFNPGTARQNVAGVLGFSPDNVRIIFAEGSGHYGRGGNPEDTAPAAAFVSQAVGRPIRLTMMRDQDFLTDAYGVPFSFRLRGGVDGQGNVVAWDTEYWTWAVDPRTEGPTLTAILRGTATAGAYRAQGQQALGGGDMSTYEFPNERWLGHHVAPSIRVQNGQLRSPKRIQLNFATESFIDELAAAAGADPIAFRLQQLQNTKKLAATAAPNSDPSHYQRQIDALEAVRKAAGWQARPAPARKAGSNSDVLTGRGCSTMGNYCNTFAGLVAEVEVNRKTGKVRATRLVQSVDPGLIVNPLGARNTVEQAVIFALSRTLHDEIRFDNKTVLSRDWVTYPILRIMDVPEQETALINRPEYSAGGLGEGPEILVPAAIANAIFDATGVRMRQIPFTPARVRAALKAAGVT